MAQWHGYFGVERLALSDANWNAIKAALAAILINNPRGAHQALQVRLRPDGDAAIVEGLFSTDDLTVDAFKNMLANATGVPVDNITHSENAVTLHAEPSRIHRFGVGGVDRLRASMFAGVGGFTTTWAQSRRECVQYLINNVAEWQ
jgi:hypothetical protein